MSFKVINPSKNIQEEVCEKNQDQRLKEIQEKNKAKLEIQL